MDSQMITLREAARRAERSVSTIRRWVRAGKLKDRRARGDAHSPLVVDSRDLLTLCTGQTPRQPEVSAPAHPVATHGHPVLDTLRDQVDTLRAQVEDLRADKARLLVELGRARADSDRWIQAADEESRARAAVEAELVKLRTAESGQGVRGLLGRFSKRWAA